MFPFVEKLSGEQKAEANAILKATASSDRNVAHENMKAIAQAFAPVLKKAVFDEDTLGNIFTKYPLAPGASPRFPLDIIAPGTEDDYVAYTMPRQGRVPERKVEGDELFIQTYKIANAIDWDLDLAKDANWPMVARALEVFRAGFTKRINDDGWHVILASANSAGFMVQDTAATQGNFTPSLVYRMKTIQKRRTRNGNLTDLFVSPEALEDLRRWSDTSIQTLGDGTRDRIFVSETDPAITRLNGVNIHELRELGEGTGGTAEEYQEYFTGTLSGSLGAGGAGDVELVIGLDLGKNDSFIMPVRDELEVFDAKELHRQGRAGVYGWMRLGMAAVDNRRSILGSF